MTNKKAELPNSIGESLVKADATVSTLGGIMDNALYRPTFPEHWKRCPLYSMAKWVNGLAFRNIAFSASGMPIIKIAEIKNGISNQTKFTQQVYDEKVRIRNGDLLFSWSGQPETSIDAYWWRGNEGWLNQHVFKVTALNDILTEFLYYLLKYLRPNFVEIARNKQTTGLGHVTKRDLKNIAAALPPLPEQRAIAHILGALDDKIELNRRMNETLEAIARALFKSWFVDFDPVRAKMAGRDTGLPPHIAALFPDRLVTSGLGEIPERWGVKKLKDLVAVIKGRSYKSAELSQSSTALVTLKSFMRGGGYKPDGLKPYTGAFKPEQEVFPGEIVVACTDVTQAAEVIGRPAIVQGSAMYKSLVASLDVLIVRSEQASMSASYLYQLLGTREFTGHTVARTTGTTVLHLAVKDVLSFEFALPSPNLIQSFTNIAQPMIGQIRLLQSESSTLTSMRDTLLPRLISGELRLRDAESFLERAL